MVLSEVVKQRVLNSVLVYLARTKATNFQRAILMGAKAKQNNNATKLDQQAQARLISCL
ncbi:hypothetical protein JP0045_02800 [Helicobacter pylori]|nr:hypothetical protein JP0045_02800 [Helicobacter pylori]